MGIGFTLKTLKALNSFDINCFVLKVSKHWVSVLSYNYVWPRGPALFATLGVPNAAGSPETCRRASSHACYSTVTPICSVADLSRSNPNKPVFQERKKLNLDKKVVKFLPVNYHCYADF